VDRDALGHEGLEALEIGGRRHGIEKFLDPAVDFRLRKHVGWLRRLDAALGGL